MKYIDINKDLIPYRFEMTLGEKTYIFEIGYNTLEDYFTIDLLKEDEPIVLGEKIVYGKPLFLSAQHKDIPNINIMPYDLSENTNRITFENMNKDVFLFIVGDEDEILD